MARVSAPASAETIASLILEQCSTIRSPRVVASGNAQKNCKSMVDLSGHFAIHFNPRREAPLHNCSHNK